jgi:FixJ family two-component response regulator
MSVNQLSDRIAILDDDESVQSALQDLIESAGMSAFCFRSAEEFLDSHASREVRCLIADVRMPGISGIELQERLSAERRPIPIIFITGLADIPTSVRAMRGGAIDFLTKPVDESALFASVERALELDRVNRREAIERAGLVSRYERLTTREREVLPLLARGLQNKQVAFELGIAEYTVQVHRGHIMRKMEAGSFAALVTLAGRLTFGFHPA